MKRRRRRIWIAFGCAVALVACGKSEKPLFAGPAFTTDPAPPGPLNGLFLTTDNGSDQLSAVDPVSQTVRFRLPVGFIPVELEGPHHVTADASGQFVYLNLSEAVVGSGSGPHGAHGTGVIPGFVLKLSAKTGNQLAFAQVDPNPGDLTLSLDGKTLYVTHYDLVKLSKMTPQDPRLGDSRLMVIDTATMNVTKRVPLCPAAHGTRLSADGKTLFATCYADEIAVVDVSDPSLPVRRVSLTTDPESPSCRVCPYALSVAPDATVWVSSLGPGGGNIGGGRVDVYDPSLGAFDVARSKTLSGRALFAAFHATPGGYLAYVPEQGPGGDHLRVYDSKGPGQPSVELPAISFVRANCLNAHMLNLSADGKMGYLVCEGDHAGPGSFVFVDLQSNSVVSSSALGVFPDGMALVPAGTP